MNNFRLISWISSVFLLVLSGGFFAIYNFKTESFLVDKSIEFITEINPSFNPKVENYYSNKCIDGKVTLKVNTDLSEIKSKLECR